jgi:hypothetical protein
MSLPSSHELPAFPPVSPDSTAKEEPEMRAMALLALMDGLGVHALVGYLSPEAAVAFEG